MSSASSHCVPIRAGFRLTGWLHSHEINPHSAGGEVKKNNDNNRDNTARKRIPFQIHFETVTHAPSAPPASLSSSSSSSSSSNPVVPTSAPSPPDADGRSSRPFIEPKPISRAGLLVTGTIQYHPHVDSSASNGQSSASSSPPSASSAAPAPLVINRFSGTADPSTGAFDIVTDGPAGTHCPTACRYVARLPSGAAGDVVASAPSDSVAHESSNPTEGTSSPNKEPLLVGLWHSNKKALYTVLGVFCINSIGTSEEPANSSEFLLDGAPLLDTAAIGEPVCPYSSMSYAGFLETGSERKDVVFTADVRLAKDKSYLLQGSMFLRVDKVLDADYFVKGKWSLQQGLQLQLFCHIGGNRAYISHTGNGYCVLDTANDWNALSAISNRTFSLWRARELSDAAVDGWNPSLPRQILTATLSQVNITDGKHPVSSRLCLYSLPQYFLSRHDELPLEAATDAFGRLHGFSVTQVDGQCVQITEHCHGKLEGATFSNMLDHQGLVLFTPMATLRCMPTSTEGIAIAVREAGDLNSLESYATFFPWHVHSLRSFSSHLGVLKGIPLPPLSQQHLDIAAVVPHPSKGEWKFCGTANYYGESQGVVYPSKRGLSSSDNPHAVCSKPLFSLPHEYVISTTGELWMGQWVNHYAVGEHTYRSSDQRWWRLRYGDQGQLLSHVELPAARSIELMEMVLQCITKTQTRMREQRLVSDEQLRAFEERASHSSYLAALADGSDLLEDECRDAQLPQKVTVYKNSKTILADCGVYRGDMAHLRDSSHGFGIAYAAPVVGEQSVHRGPLRYEGELRLDLQHGFGHSVKIVNADTQLIHALGQHRFNLTHGVNAMWSYERIPFSNAETSTVFHNLQRLVMSSNVSGVVSGLGYILNQTKADTQSCSLGHLFWAKGKYPVLEGISLERLSFTTRLALWKREGNSSRMSGPIIRLIYDEPVRLSDQGYDDERVGVKLEMFSGTMKDRKSHGRVHSTHPLLMLMCAAIEHQAKELDMTTLSWLQATARFESKRRRFHAMPVEAAASPMRLTGHTCDGCGARLSIGNHWQCSRVLCSVDFCSQCKGDSEWGREVKGHFQTHGLLSVFNENSLNDKEAAREEYKKWKAAGNNESDSIAVSATDKKETHSTAETASSSSSTPSASAAAAAVPASASPAPANEPALPFSLDLSFDGQREATFLGPTLQSALSKYFRSSPSSTSAAATTAASASSTNTKSGDSSSSSSSTSSIGVISSLIKSKSDNNNLRENLLSSDEQKAADESPPVAASPMPVQSDQVPTIATILTQLILLLDQSTDLLATCDERYVIAAVPSIRRDGTPVHLGSDWHQKLGMEHPIDATFLRLQSHGASARRNFHLFLLSRIRSFMPLLTWLRDRCQLVTSGKDKDSDSYDPSVPPLRLSTSHTVVLYVVLQHYGSLLRMVKHELTVAMPDEARLPRSMPQQPPNAAAEHPSTSSSSSEQTTTAPAGESYAAVSQVSPDPTLPPAAASSYFPAFSAAALLESPYWFASWVRRTSGNMMQYVLEQDAHFIEYAQTSTLPAMQLWIRLMDTKDLIVACLPLLQAEQQQP